MLDFTLEKYRDLLVALQRASYAFYTFQEYCEGKAAGKYLLLRHDIDRNPTNALKISKLEHDLKIKSTFYFKTSSDVFNPEIIKEIENLGHEIGYHYRDLVDARGNEYIAIEKFKANLCVFQKETSIKIKTISMDGCPLSKYDNRNLWKTFNYRDFGIIGEPYFDIDINDVFYLTDTARCWDGGKYSVRDKIESGFTQSFHKTDDIIEAARNCSLPDRMMITTHPQRWTDKPLPWLHELIFQNIKNSIKKMLVVRQ